MELLYPRCAGLDVHKDVVVACVRLAQTGGKALQEVRSFATTTSELCKLEDWLNGHQVTHVVMEASGVYWKPVWHVLEESLELILANAQHVKNVPGRKSDVNDAMWLADLLAHGLVRGSFVPPTHIQEVRDLSRTRKQLTREIIQHTNRIQKTLEDANIKLASAISNVLGKSGRAILEAIIAGETKPEKLVELCSGRLKASRKELIEALRGRVTAHHRCLLKLHLAQVDQLTSGMRELEARMGEILAPFQEHVDNLTTIPGVNDTTARVLAGEIGLDMARFPTAGHLISWALPQTRRECRQTPLDTYPQGCAVAQDRSDQCGVGRYSHQEFVPPLPIRETQSAARRQKGHRRGRGFDADLGLLHHSRPSHLP